MMNKKLIALAVAAAMTAPAAALADATLYGKLHMSIDYFDIDGGFKGWALNRGPGGPGASRANRVGVKGSEDLGGGLKAIYQVEFGVDMANEADYAIANGDRGNEISMRNSFVGLAGSFGTFLVGRHDTPFKISTAKLDMFTDTMADYNGTVGFQDVRADNAIAYISPSFSGFQFAGAIVPGAASTVGGDINIDSDSLAEGWSLAAIYSNGPFYGAVGFERFEEDLLASDGIPGNVGVITLPSQVPNDPYDKWRVGLGILDWNGFTAAGIYEQQDNGTTSDDLWQIQGGYSFGNNMIKGMYGQRDNEAKSVNDHDTWAIGVDHNFSKRTTAYVLYTDVDIDKTKVGDWSGFSLGMIHKF